MTSSCRLPSNFGFYQPITLEVAVPDGPPEYKAGWHAGCSSGMGLKTFANAQAKYKNSKGTDFGSGVYQHDQIFQLAWGHGFFACAIHAGTFVEYNAMRHGPLQ